MGPRAARQPKAPAHLKVDGTSFWKRVLTDYVIEDAHDLARLQVVCEALDRIAECRDRIAQDGAWVEGRFGLKQHPALVMEDRQRATFLKAVRELSLDLVESQPTRPPSGGVADEHPQPQALAHPRPPPRPPAHRGGARPRRPV
jgi:P27 family predicted phage terminase small subunit